MVKNLPSIAGDAGLIPGWGTKIPHATGQLSQHATTTELAHLNERARVPQTTEPTRSGACAPQLERSPCATTKKIPHASTKIRVLQLRPDTTKKKKKKKRKKEQSKQTNKKDQNEITE